MTMKHLTGQYFLNTDLRAEEIREQIGELCRAGYRGGIRSRTGGPGCSNCNNDVKSTGKGANTMQRSTLKVAAVLKKKLQSGK